MPAAAEGRERLVAERNRILAEQAGRKDKIWCFLTMCLDDSSLQYVKLDCRNPDDSGDGAKALAMLQQRYNSIDKATVRTLMVQLSQLKMGHAESSRRLLGSKSSPGGACSTIRRDADGLAIQHDGAERTDSVVRALRRAGDTGAVG